ncbi:hypothetical protein FIBSPDRAFT_293667 [Athelia psychrophila]|uniref:Uncharacterized protein n=1 Tax=Athelia psychrophila TaxID=1759441 RepID=A0A167XFS5_9AGAM|nr:hypothetical protein FIBSPDRAFT_293667 [Fibularhizoctonia sp. CBS 109695]
MTPRLPSEMRREMHMEKRWCKCSMSSYLQLMPSAEDPLAAHELEGDAGAGGCQGVHPHSRHSSWEADAIDSTCRTSVLRSDAENADKYYRLKYAALRSPACKEDVEAQKSFKFVDENFAPMHFIHTYPSDMRQGEMSFHLTNCQASVQRCLAYGPTREPPSSTSLADT